MINDVPIKHTYNGNSLTRNWDFTFPIATTDGTDIFLYKTTVDDENNILSVELIVANYNVDVAGRFVTYPTIVSELPLLTSNEKITLIRLEPLSQESDWRNKGPFNAETMEAALDKLTMICQQLSEAEGRALKVSVTYGGDIDLTFPPPEAGKIIGWNPGGTALENKDNPNVYRYIYFIIPEPYLTEGTDKIGKIRLDFAGTITQVKADVSTPPTGQSILIDINKNGTSIWNTHQENRLEVGIGQNYGAQLTFDTTAIALENYLTIDIDRVGSTVPGGKLVVRVKVRTA